MKIRRLEDLWDEIGIQPNKENFRGYIIAHFETIYLGLRDVVCVNINVFNRIEGLQFIKKCCDTYNCKIVFVDQGEIWITKKDSPVFAYEIPSRFSKNKEDHVFRGKLLNYPDAVIESYFID